MLARFLNEHLDRSLHSQAHENLSTSTALELVQRHWHLNGAISELPSYADRNFKIDTENTSYVFKSGQSQWSYADLDIENRGLLHLAKTCPELALPRYFLSEDGRHIIHDADQQSKVKNSPAICACWSFVDGRSVCRMLLNR